MKKILLNAAAALSIASAAAATGGPDSYGYTWKDSNEPNGPVYNWIEIATPQGGTGTYRSVVACDDCHEAGIPLGFNFPFYGVNQDSISLSSNGTVYFENVYLGLSNVCMPGTPGYTMAQYNFIAHMWDDLDPSSQGGIYTKAFPNYFVIEFYNVVPCCGVGDGDTWEVILFKNGNILMQYKELSNIGLNSGHTIGIQNDPATGLQYQCDASGNTLANGRAILFSPPTFSCPPVAQNILGTSAGFCTGNTVTLNTGTASIAQVWSTAAVTQTVSVNAAGNYSVIVLDTNGCSVLDTISVAEYALPVVNLGADVSACGSALLDAGNAGATYSWSNSATTQTISVNTNGTYSVTVTDANGCTGTDDNIVTINALPVVNLGADVVQCEGTVTLDASNAGSVFSWSTGAATQTVTVNTSGTYSVLVTDANTCSNSDTVTVTINSNPVVNLGADVEQCGGSVTLDAANAGATFLWNNSTTAQTLNVTVSGSYDVVVTDAVTGCIGKDTVSVTINSIPAVTFSLAQDTACDTDAAFALSGGAPSGGVYFGNGVAGGMFDPSVSGTGSHTVYYTYTDTNGCADTAAHIVFVDVCAGIEMVSSGEIMIYPNPANEIVHVRVQNHGAVTAEVYNSLGQAIYSVKSADGIVSLNTSSVAEGIYFIRIISGNKTISTHKLIVKR